MAKFDAIFCATWAMILFGVVTMLCVVLFSLGEVFIALHFINKFW